MKSEDLMIGDWVRIIDDDTDACFDARVEVIDMTGNIYVKTLSDETAYPYSVDCAEPISLTPEILEKNGFHLAKADRLYITDRYVWGVEGTRDGAIVEITFYNPDVLGVKVLTKIHTQSSHESGINSVHSCDIESVHELQHALRLCKIDKTIEL